MLHSAFKMSETNYFQRLQEGCEISKSKQIFFLFLEYTVLNLKKKAKPNSVQLVSEHTSHHLLQLLF